MATTAATTTTLSRYQCDRQQLRRVLGLMAWMEYCNQNPNVRHASFRRTEKPVGYTEPTDIFWNPQDISSQPSGTPNGKTLCSENPDNHPFIADFAEYMQFIYAMNAGAVDFVKDETGESLGAFEPLQKENMAMYVHQADNIEYPIDANDKKTKVYLLQLANRMLNAFTEFRTYGFQALDEQTLTDKDQTAYELVSALHAITLDRRGSGKIQDEGQVFWKMVRRLLKAPLAFFFYPVFVIIGFGLSLMNMRGNQLPVTTESYGLRRFNLFSSIFFSMGDAGSRYWAEAGFDDPSIGKWGSIAFPRKFVGYFFSKGLVLLPEAIVKSFLFPLKWALEYDQWAVDGYPRRFIDGLESTLIGILALPVIFANHALAAIVDVIDKTFSKPENDPGLKDLKVFLESIGFELDLKNPGLGWPLIIVYKLFRPLFDTIPRVLSRGLTNTLRSVLPAMPGTTKEFRDKFFDGLERSIYTTAFVLNAIFFGTLAAVGIGGAAGATVPGWIATLFGTESGSIGAAKFFNGFMHALGNGFSTIGAGIASMIQNPQSLFGFFKDMLVDLFTKNPISVVKSFFSSIDFSNIAHWSPKTVAIASSVAAVGLIVVLPVVLVVVAQKKVQGWYRDKSAALKSWFSGTTSDPKALPGLKQTYEDVAPKLKAQAPKAKEATSCVSVARGPQYALPIAPGVPDPKDAMRAKLVTRAPAADPAVDPPAAPAKSATPGRRAH